MNFFFFTSWSVLIVVVRFTGRTGKLKVGRCRCLISVSMCVQFIFNINVLMNNHMWVKYFYMIIFLLVKKLFFSLFLLLKPKKKHISLETFNNFWWIYSALFRQLSSTFHCTIACRLETMINLNNFCLFFRRYTYFYCTCTLLSFSKLLCSVCATLVMQISCIVKKFFFSVSSLLIFSWHFLY